MFLDERVVMADEYYLLKLKNHSISHHELYLPNDPYDEVHEHKEDEVVVVVDDRYL